MNQISPLHAAWRDDPDAAVPGLILLPNITIVLMPLADTVGTNNEIKLQD